MLLKVRPLQILLEHCSETVFDGVFESLDGGILAIAISEFLFQTLEVDFTDVVQWGIIGPRFGGYIDRPVDYRSHFQENFRDVYFLPITLNAFIDQFNRVVSRTVVINRWLIKTGLKKMEDLLREESKILSGLITSIDRFLRVVNSFIEGKTRYFIFEERV